MHSYPKRFLPWLWSIVAVLSMSGVSLIPGMFELRLDWDVPVSLGASRIVLAALHALAAFAMLIAVGALLPVHMRLGLRQKRNYRSGVILAVWLGLLASTALGIYYVGQQDWAIGMSLAHTILGLALVFPFGWHWFQGRVLRRRRAVLLHAH